MPFIAGFFDESIDGDLEGQCYTVAGLIGNNLVTSVLEMRWQDVLNHYELDYFKASELSAGTGQFQKFRDDPKDFNWRRFSSREKDLFTKIKTDFTDVIVRSSNGLYGVAAVVILPDLERLREEFDHAKTLPKPYFLCANAVLVEAGVIMNEQNVGYQGHGLCWLRPIFDSHERYSGIAKVTWDTFCQKNPTSSKYLLEPHYEDDTEYLTLQAADNFAFEARKFIATQQKNIPPRKSFRRLVDGNAVVFYKFDYDSLKIVADAQIGVYPERIREKLAGRKIEQSMQVMRDIIAETP